MAQDRAEGALLGLCIGDCAGAVLEIPLREEVDLETVEWALSLPGGGAHRIGPAQITDESELALALAHALAEHGLPTFPADDVATSYAQWLESKPFTVGKHCRAPFAAALKAINGEGRYPPAQSMAKVAAKTNRQTQANGALTRIAPLAIWGHDLEDAVLACLAEEDATLTHPHENCTAANAVFCIAIARLIGQPGDADSAIAAAMEYAKFNAPPCVCDWIEEAIEPRTWPSVTQAGSSDWVRWPLFYSFRHLKLRSSFETALRDILGRGGATAANAAVVGALLGALHGSAAIPDALKGPVLARGPLSRGNGRHPRPPWLHTRIVPLLTQQLLDARTPTDGMELVTPDKIGSR